MIAATAQKTKCSFQNEAFSFNSDCQAIAILSKTLLSANTTGNSSWFAHYTFITSIFMLCTDTTKVW